ncbi:MAG: SDR family oxidoreductase [Mycobacteriaceae bacterium]
MSFTVMGKKVLITGAAMGMGKLYANLAAAQGASVIILWDINSAALEETAEALRAKGATVHSQVVDVASLDAITEAAAAVRTSIGNPDVLINNAGVVRDKYFWENDQTRDIKFVMDINAYAPMYITREFIKPMIDNKDSQSRILNIASAAGTLPQPKMAVYAASKWAALGWSDSLRIELDQAGHKHVKVTTVCPSFIDTGMFEGAKGPLLTPILTPEEVVDKAWAAMLKGKPLLMMPMMVYASRLIKGILPVRLYDFIAGRIFGLYHTMDDFTGRG